jgi:3-oxoacyl-[acyl-carrier protein] reductase
MPIHSPAIAAKRTPRLADKTAVVTGATDGIGRAIAHALVLEGARVVVHGRDAERAKRVCSELTDIDGDAICILADLASADDCQRLVDEAWNWKSVVDIWVNSAGADVLTGEAASWSFESKFDLLWQIDVRAMITISRAVGQRMFDQHSTQQPASILHIGWDQAECGMSGNAGQMFGPIKSAVMAFSRSQAQTLAPRVRVNCVAPGWIRTAWGAEASDDWQRRAVEESLRQRWGTPKDVAHAVCFLASDQADFITGQVIPVNGGFRHGSS